MAYKVIHAFRSTNYGGWTEVYYWSGEDAAAAMTAARELAQLRRRCLNVFSNIAYVRVSNTDRQRDALFHAYLGDSGQGTCGQDWGEEEGLVSEPTQVAVNVRLFSGPTGWRSMLVRGVPDTALTSSGDLAQGTPFITGLRAWANGCKRFAIQKIQHGVASVINAMTLVSGKLHQIITDAPIAGIPPGRLIYISRYSGVSNLAGLWRIRVGMGNNQYMVYPKARLNAGTYPTPTATANAVTYQYPAISDYEIIGVTSRRTGRPIYLPRGKRSVQRG